MTKQFAMTFNPLANAPKEIIALTYNIDTQDPESGKVLAELFLKQDGYHRSKFRKVIGVKRIERAVENKEEVKVEGKSEVGPALDIVVEAEVELVAELDPFAQFIAPEWTITSLNSQLERLSTGETLIIDELPDTIYHGAIGVSCSKLKLFIECPQKYKAKYVDCVIPDTEKAYFDMGKAIHTVVLEPHLFASSYICQPETIKRRAGKDWTAFKEAADANNQIILTKVQWDDMPILRQSLESNSTAKALSTGGISERSIFKRDIETGLLIKCRPDYQIDDLIIDLKSSKSANPRFFGADAKKLGYHIQDALYTDVSGANEFAFFVVESSCPFVITAPVILDEHVKRLGYLKYRKAM